MSITCVSKWIVKNVLPCIERLQSSRLLTRLFRLEPVQPEVPGAPPFECHPEDAMEAWAKTTAEFVFCQMHGHSDYMKGLLRILESLGSYGIQIMRRSKF